MSFSAALCTGSRHPRPSGSRSSPPWYRIKAPERGGLNKLRITKLSKHPATPGNLQPGISAGFSLGRIYPVWRSEMLYRTFRILVLAPRHPTGKGDPRLRRPEFSGRGGAIGSQREFRLPRRSRANHCLRPAIVVLGQNQKRARGNLPRCKHFRA